MIDGGYPTTAPMIMASIAEARLRHQRRQSAFELGAAPDHAGGLTVLQQASGAELWASEASADTSPPAATTRTLSCR